jgi:hypothetical protein
VSTSYTLNDTGANDSFNLDVVDLKLASAQGAGEYATGYTVELWAGGSHSLATADAGDPGTVELMQANIDLRLPWGNGIDLKIGQFLTVVGAETDNYNENAFYNRSHGFAIEPTHHTGILASYAASDDVSLAFGVVNDTTTARTNDDDGGSAYLASISYTLSDSAGALGGTVVTYARVDGAGNPTETDNQYLGVSLPAGWPIEGASYSLAWDIQEVDASADSNVLAHYLSYALNDKATLNARWETGNRNDGSNDYDGIDSWTIGIDYQVWENVISRVEYRSDDWEDKSGGAAESLTFNVIYSF